MSKKIPIHFNKEDEKNQKEVSQLLGLTGVYGEVPKTLKFGITLTPEYIKLLEKFIPDLDPENLDILFNAIKKIKEKRKAENRQDPAFLGKKV